MFSSTKDFFVLGPRIFSCNWAALMKASAGDNVLFLLGVNSFFDGVPTPGIILGLDAFVLGVKNVTFFFDAFNVVMF